MPKTKKVQCRFRLAVQSKVSVAAIAAASEGHPAIDRQDICLGKHHSLSWQVLISQSTYHLGERDSAVCNASPVESTSAKQDPASRLHPKWNC
jgi:hypothetical protein